MPVVVETTMYPSRYNTDHFTDYRGFDSEQVEATIETLESEFNVSFFFLPNRIEAQRKTHALLLSRLRSVLV